MTVFKVPHIICDRCGNTEQTATTPDGWFSDVVWHPRDPYEADDGHGWRGLVTHTAHNKTFSWLQSHLCDECVQTAEQFPDGFVDRTPSPECSWCGSEDVICDLRADYVLEEHSIGACLDCSPFTIPESADIHG